MSLWGNPTAVRHFVKLDDVLIIMRTGEQALWHALLHIDRQVCTIEQSPEMTLSYFSESFYERLLDKHRS